MASELSSLLLVLFCCVHGVLSSQDGEKVCTYQDEALKEGVCGCLPESVPVHGFAEKGTSNHYHFRVEDLGLINDENPKFHLRVSPCSGGVAVWVKTNPFPWPTEYDFRYEANNTEPGSIKTVDTNLYNRDYYITVDAVTDANYTLVAYTNRNFLALPPVGGGFGAGEAFQEKLTVPAIKVKFDATDSDRNAMYQLYKAKVVDEGAAEESQPTESGATEGGGANLLPVCLDYSASRPCRVMYTACGIEQFGVPIDDGGFEPRENGTKIMKFFRGEPGEKFFVNVVVVGENGIKTAYRGAQVFIANVPASAAVDSDTQITVVAIVSAIFGALALLMAFAMLKMRKAVNMKDPTKKKKKKAKKEMASSKKQIGSMLRGVVPNPKENNKAMPPKKKQLGVGTAPPPRPPPPGPPPRGAALRNAGSAYVVRASSSAPSPQGMSGPGNVSKPAPPIKPNAPPRKISPPKGRPVLRFEASPAVKEGKRATQATAENNNGMSKPPPPPPK